MKYSTLFTSFYENVINCCGLNHPAVNRARENSPHLDQRQHHNQHHQYSARVLLFRNFNYMFLLILYVLNRATPDRRKNTFLISQVKSFVNRQLISPLLGFIGGRVRGLVVLMWLMSADCWWKCDVENLRPAVHELWEWTLQWRRQQYLHKL